MYQGSPDCKDLWANKHILYFILTFTGKKHNSLVLGVILSVLYLDIFTMTPTAAFKSFEDRANLYLVVHLARHYRNLFVSKLGHK